MKEYTTNTHNNLKTRSRSHRNERDLEQKRERIITVVKGHKFHRINEP